MSLSGTCQRGRHTICGGATCACTCHPGTIEERQRAAAETIDAYLADLGELVSSTGKHAGHMLRQVGQCVYCSCGSRYQGRLP